MTPPTDNCPKSSRKQSLKRDTAASAGSGLPDPSWRRQLRRCRRGRLARRSPWRRWRRGFTLRVTEDVAQKGAERRSAQRATDDHAGHLTAVRIVDVVQRGTRRRRRRPGRRRCLPRSHTSPIGDPAPHIPIPRGVRPAPLPARPISACWSPPVCADPRNAAVGNRKRPRESRRRIGAACLTGREERPFNPRPCG